MVLTHTRACMFVLVNEFINDDDDDDLREIKIIRAKGNNENERKKYY